MNANEERPLIGVCIMCADEVYQESADSWIEDAVEVEISAGYGSKYDLRQFRALMCDHCMSYLLRRNRIKSKREYLGAQVLDCNWTPIEHYGENARNGNNGYSRKDKDDAGRIESEAEPKA